MDLNIRKTLDYWINGIINHNHFTYGLIKDLDENGKANVNSTITIDDHVYDLNITLKEKPSDIKITVDIDTEPALNKIKKLKKETEALDLSITRE